MTYMTSILKNVSIDKLHNIVNKYNKLYHKTVKMKPADVKKKKKTLTLVKNIMIKILDLNLVILLEYQSVKTFFAKDYVSNWSEKVLFITKV